jgi:hypothetical protein
VPEISIGRQHREIVADRDDHTDAAVPAFRSVQSMRCSRSFALGIAGSA